VCRSRGAQCARFADPNYRRGIGPCAGLQVVVRQRQPVESPVTTVLADGMACRAPDSDSLAIMQAHVDEVLAVGDAQFQKNVWARWRRLAGKGGRFCL